MWITIMLLLATCCIKDSVGLQRFAEQPKYTEVNPGQDALLSCKIIDKRGTCSWQKDNKPVGIYPKKYEWAGTSLGLQGIQSPHIGGDCSLWIRSATLDFDDGLWECQVTASDFTTQDALTSQPVRLVVRVAPQRPRLEHEGVHVPPGHNVTVDSSAVATVKCVSHYGNPPAQLKWFLGDQEIQPLHPQTNATEPDNPRTWSAASVVQIPATRERHGTIMKCVALHESYAAKSVGVEARLDIKYAPTVRLLGSPQIDLEEGKDSLVLRCQADANPPANIVWRRAGRSEIASLQESLQLRPVSRRDAGLYTCQAQNSVGTSETLSVQLDIKYPPKIQSAGPDRLTTAPLFSPAAFECVAEGNPPPTFKWVQRIRSQMSSYLERGRDFRLVIDNVTYDYQGEYECRATNIINGQERTVASEPIALQVVGAPQVLRMSQAIHSISVRKGESATLSLVVCADPRPRHVAWEWGSLRLEAGAGIGRYRVDEVSQDSREDCYVATLHITEADPQDERPYYLVVENERGTDRHAIHLHVEEPLEMSYLMGIAGGCLAAVLLLICLCVYAVRTKRCCFKGRDNFKASEKDSEKADLKSRSDSVGGPQLDSIYTTPAGFHHYSQGSPEAMKSTTTQNGLRGPGVLQTRTTTTTSTSNNNNNNNNTMNSIDRALGVHHHRDLFSGSLGIPDVTTHVGSVIHAFETLALKHNIIETGEKPYETGSNKSLIATTELQQQQQQQQNSDNNNINNKANQFYVSNKSQIPLSHVHFQRQLPSPIPLNATTLQTTNVNNNNNNNLFYNHELDQDSSNSYSIDDYRKNQFGTQSKRHGKSSNNNNNNSGGGGGVNNKYDDSSTSYKLRKGNKIYSSNNNYPKKYNTHNSYYDEQDLITTVPSTQYNSQLVRSGGGGLLGGSGEGGSGGGITNNNFDTNLHYTNFNQNHNQQHEPDDTFLRGTTVSQSFIKNIRGLKTKTNRDSIGIKRERNTNSTGRLTKKKHTNNNNNNNYNLNGTELEQRYREYGESGGAIRNSKRKSYKPRTIDRAEI